MRMEKIVPSPDGNVKYAVNICDNCGKASIEPMMHPADGLHPLKTSIFLTGGEDLRAAMEWLACSLPCARIVFNRIIDLVSESKFNDG